MLRPLLTSSKSDYLFRVFDRNSHIMTNSVDPDKLEANLSGSTLFTKTGHVVFSKRRVNSHFQDLGTIKKKSHYIGKLLK